MPVEGASDWILWALGGLATAFSVPLAVVKRNRDRSRKNERQLEGDDNDPNHEGVLEIVHETRAEVHEVNEQTQANRRMIRSGFREVCSAIDEGTDADIDIDDVVSTED